MKKGAITPEEARENFVRIQSLLRNGYIIRYKKAATIRFRVNG